MTSPIGENRGRRSNGSRVRSGIKASFLYIPDTLCIPWCCSLSSRARFAVSSRDRVDSQHGELEVFARTSANAGQQLRASERAAGRDFGEQCRGGQHGSPCETASGPHHLVPLQHHLYELLLPGICGSLLLDQGQGQEGARGPGRRPGVCVHRPLLQPDHPDLVPHHRPGPHYPHLGGSSVPHGAAAGPTFPQRAGGCLMRLPPPRTSLVLGCSDSFFLYTRLEFSTFVLLFV